MDNGIIQHIANLFKRLNSGVLLVENNDKFLYREDVIKGLRLKGVEIETGTALQQRVIYELRDKESLLILLSQNNKDTLEDIKQNSQSFDFFFENLFEGYHIPSIIALDISILDQLFKENQFFNLNKQETLRKVESLKSTLALKKEVAFDFEEFVLLLENSCKIWADAYSVTVSLSGRFVLFFDQKWQHFNCLFLNTLPLQGDKAR